MEMMGIKANHEFKVKQLFNFHSKHASIRLSSVSEKMSWFKWWKLRKENRATRFRRSHWLGRHR